MNGYKRLKRLWLLAGLGTLSQACGATLTLVAEGEGRAIIVLAG